jgi:2-hydroxychromene-2-carboxylate isomerase
MDFYFDFLSPFSYFAWLRLERIKTELNLSVNYKPVALGPLLNHWQIKGPGEVTPKREFLLKQMIRYAHREKILFTTPKTHPFNSLYALRLALNGVAGVNQKAVIATLWKAGWQSGIDMGEPDELLKILKEAALPADELYERSFSREAKAELKSNIAEAISRGVFGVPSFYINDELFWGNDSLDDLKRFVLGEDQLDRAKLKAILDNTPRAASQSI